MKYLFFVLTLTLQILSIFSLKLLDNFYFIVAIFVLCIFIGGIIKFSKSENDSIKSSIGWGLLYGSLTSLLAIIIFMVWLAFNFPK